MRGRASALHRDRPSPEIDGAVVITLPHADLGLQPECRGGSRASLFFNRACLEPFGLFQMLFPLIASAGAEQGIGERMHSEPVGRREADGTLQRLDSARGPPGRQMQSSKIGEGFDIIRVEQQRDDELGVSFGFAAVLDIGAAQCFVRCRVVRRDGDSLLQQPDRLFIVQMQLRQPGERTVQFAPSYQQDDPIRLGDQRQIGIITMLPFFRRRR